MDEVQARRVAKAEQTAFQDLIAHGTDPDRGDKGLDGIAERVTDVADRRIVEDLITDRRQEFRIRNGRLVDADPTPRIQAVPPTKADSLKADLRSLQEIANRRGGTWLVRWATMFTGVQPGAFTVNVDTDPAFAAYLQDFPFGPDPRD